MEYEKIEKLLDKSCFVIDFLPKQVPRDSHGQFFKIENYMLNNYEQFGLSNRFIRVILKLMCYYHVTIRWGGEIDQPAPEKITEIVNEIMYNHSGTLNVLFPENNALLVFEWDCMNLSIYNPDDEMQTLMRDIKMSEGLFWREATN